MEQKLEGAHCSYHCPNYQGGSVVSLCNKYGENLNYSKKGKPLALGVCFADELKTQLKATQDELETVTKQATEMQKELGKQKDELEAVKAERDDLELFCRGESARTERKLAQYKQDAERYWWLRTEHWSNSNFCVVENPKKAVKLGSNCPSGRLLDELIDNTLKQG